jgi:hypothetical protein
MQVLFDSQEEKDALLAAGKEVSNDSLAQFYVRLLQGGVVNGAVPEPTVEEPDSDFPSEDKPKRGRPKKEVEPTPEQVETLTNLTN